MDQLERQGGGLSSGRGHERTETGEECCECHPSVSPRGENESEGGLSLFEMHTHW